MDNLVKVSVFLTKDEHYEARVLAAKKAVSLSQLLGDMLRKALARTSKEKPAA